MPTLKKDIYQINSKLGSGAPINDTQWVAQTFTPSVTGNLDKVYLAIHKNSAPSDLIVAIRATSGGIPTGSDLASETISVGSVSSSLVDNLAITFASPASLTASTTYAIVVRSPSSSGGNYYRWEFAHSIVSGSADYVSGQVCISTDSGATWPDTRTSDFSFITEMSVVVATPGIDVHIFGDDSASFGSLPDANAYLAQTFTPTVSGELKKIGIILTKFSSQTGGNVTLEIQAVDGSFKPDGTALATQTIADADLSNFNDNDDVATQIVTFTTPTDVTASTMYAVVLKFLDIGGGDYYRVGTAQKSQYADGKGWSSTNSGSTWSDESKDMGLLVFILEPTITTQTINSNAHILATTTQTINSDAHVGSIATQTITSDAHLTGTTSQTINSDGHIQVTTSQTINSDAVILVTTSQAIASGAYVVQPVSQTITSDARISRNQPVLKFYVNS